jgi:hypothetical protein
MAIFSPYSLSEMVSITLETLTVTVAVSKAPDTEPEKMEIIVPVTKRLNNLRI